MFHGLASLRSKMQPADVDVPFVRREGDVPEAVDQALGPQLGEVPGLVREQARGGVALGQGLIDLALIEITKIGKECHHGCEVMQQTGDCVMPREGVFTRVLRGGTVRPGDNIRILSEDET